MKTDTRLIKNERGVAALISVVVVSIALVTSLASIYTYIVSRARQQARIKEAYKLVSVTEEAAKTVRMAWDTTAANMASQSSPFTCCNSANNTNSYATSCLSCDGTGTTGKCGPTSKGCIQQIAGTGTGTTGSFLRNLPSPDMSNCANSCTLPGQVSMCFQNVDNPNSPYCFYAAQAGGLNSVQFEIRRPDDLRSGGRLEQFYARLDTFFDASPSLDRTLTERNPKEMIAYKAPAIFGWFFAEKEALAVLPTYQLRASNTSATMPNCQTSTTYFTSPGGGANDGCMKCGTGTNHVCASVYACPSTYPQCAAYDGSSTQAIFEQDFMISPPCYDSTGVNCY